MKKKKVRTVLVIIYIILCILLLLAAATIVVCHFWGIDGEAILWLSTVMAAILVGQFQKPTVTDAYADYAVCDSLLVSVATEEDVFRWENGDWGSFYYQKIPGLEDDAFVWAEMVHGDFFPDRQWHVLQNPDNPVDVWTDWTVREIQIYSLSYSFQSDERFNKDNVAGNTVATIMDAACLQEIVTFATSEELRELSGTRESMDSVGDLSNAYFANTPGQPLYLYLRVIFNEAEGIAWDTPIYCYRDTETGEYYFTLYRDNTAWNLTESDLGVNVQECWVENLPALEAFLQEATATYLANAENG